MNRKQLKNLDKARKAQQDQLNENKKKQGAEGSFAETERVEVNKTFYAEIPNVQTDMNVKSIFTERQMSRKDVENALAGCRQNNILEM